MWHERKVRWLTAAMFAVTAVAMITEGVAYHQTYQDYVATVANSDAITARIRVTRRLYLDLLDAETGQRGYLLTGDQTYLEPFERGASALATDLVELQRTQPPERAALIAEVERLSRAKVAELRETIRLFNTQGFAAAQSVVRANEGKVFMDGIRQALNGMIVEDEQRRTGLHTAMGQAIAASSRNWQMGAVAVLAALTLCITGFWRISSRNAHLGKQLLHEARHDGLTGLPNRTFFRETLDYMLAVAKREGLQAAVLYLDLDGFKEVNDRLGHDTGDIALVEVAKTLRRLMRESDFVARLGGDEFAILIPSGAGEVAQFCTRIERAIRALAPPALEDSRLGTSIGVACYPEDGETADQLIGVADQRMFERKRATKTQAAAAVPA